MTNKTKGTTLSNGVFRLPMITRILSKDKHFFYLFSHCLIKIILTFLVDILGLASNKKLSII